MLSRLRDWAYTFSLGTAPDDPPLNNSKEPLTNAPTKEEVIHLDKPVLGQRTPFHERGASSDCCLECCGTPRCMTCCKYTSYTLAVTLGWFIVWNLLKIPYYAQDLMTNVTYDTEACSVDPVPRECYGFEFQANLGAWVGWRSYKLFASPANFLAPHAMMGCLLEAFFIAALVGGWGVVRKLSYAMLPLAFVFGLHVLPAENGFPSREAGVPANLLCVIVIWLAVGVGAAGLLGPRRYPQLRPKGDMALYWAWVVIACDANLAPVAEWGLILAFGGASSPDGEQPLPQSGHDTLSSVPDGLGWTFTWLALLGGLAYFAHFGLLVSPETARRLDEATAPAREKVEAALAPAREKLAALLAPLKEKLDELVAKMRPAKTAATPTEQTPILQPAKA